MKHSLTTDKGILKFSNFKTSATKQFALILILHSALSLTTADAQCNDLTTVQTATITSNAVTLNWTSANGDADHTYELALERDFNGGTDGPWTTVQTFTVLTPNTFSHTFTNLLPNTGHRVCVREICDDGEGLTAISCSAAFQTLPTAFTLTQGTLTSPGCPYASPMYAPNGSFSVAVGNGDCAGTYTLSATPIAGSGPNGSTPPTLPTQTGLAAGTVTFTNAGAGAYTITATETSGCAVAQNPVSIMVTIADGTDTVAPLYYVTDVMGNIVADNDPLTIRGTNYIIGTINLPEGECTNYSTYFVHGIDQCDGIITDAASVTATASTTPAFNPQTNVNVVHHTNSVWAVNIDWKYGNTVITIRGRDASGNFANGTTGLTLRALAVSTTNPVLSVLGPTQVTIPVCANTTTALYAIQIDELCGNSAINFSNLIVNFGGATAVINFTGNNYREYLVAFTTPGLYLFSFVYTTPAGNVVFIDQIINVQQAAANVPPVIFANSETITIPDCGGPCRQVVYSFIIEDDCAPINIAAVQFNGGGSGLPNLNGGGFFFTDAVSCVSLPCKSVYFEVQACVMPGTFFPLITYQGITAQPTLTVLEAPPQAATITMPALNVTPLPCEAAAETTFRIDIRNDCGATILPANASFTLGGEAITPDVFNVAEGYAQFSHDFTCGDNGAELIATYTNAQGLVSTASTTVQVNCETDEWAPIIIYPSQDINLALDPCAATNMGTVTFEVSVIENCTNGIVPEITLNTGFAVQNTSGNTYSVTAPTGNHLVTITATDAAGNVRVEDFFINITQDAAEPTQLACNGAINVALNSACQALLTPEMLLNGTFGCLDNDDFIIQVMDGNPANGALVDGCGTFEVHVSLQPGIMFPGFTECWGEVHTEDLTPPQLTCPDDTDEIVLSQTYQEIAGELATGDETFQPELQACWLDFFTPIPTPALHFYDAHSFTVTETDVYTFDLYDPNGGDWIGGVFRNDFDAQNPCLNMLTQYQMNTFNLGLGTYTAPFGLVFPNGAQPQWRITLQLEAGKSYTLVTTSFAPNATGSYTWRAYSAGEGQLNSLPTQIAMERRTLFCEDRFEIQLSALPMNVPRCYKTDSEGHVIFPTNLQQRERYQQLLDHLALTGYPNADAVSALGGSVNDNDACGYLEICVTETSVQQGDCGDFIITRIFTAKDEQDGDFDGVNTTPCSGSPNMSFCTQEIRVRQPNAQDVILPALTVLIDCDEDFEADANGNPAPVDAGYPFVRTAFGVNLLNDAYCNLAASYFDAPRIATCTQGYKLLRRWTYTDWCNPSQSNEYSQTIKAGDITAPVATCAAEPLVFETEAFDCTASFLVPLPTVTDNCSSNWTVLTEIVSDIVSGSDTQTIVIATILPDAPTRFISGVPFGCHRFRYTTTDDCGNASVLECEFCVEDNSEPTAVCDDALNISIGGNGYARIYKEDIDEGSWDNCTLTELKVRRLLTKDTMSCEMLEDPVFTEWNDFIDVNCCDVGTMIRIELRATDAGGLMNTCWMEVLVEDKIKPVCSPPHAMTVQCGDLHPSFNPADTLQVQAMFGNATATDNCPGVTTRELAPLISLSECGFGTIVRRFQAIDAAGNVSIIPCPQVITVEQVNQYEISFPKDASAHCGVPMPDTIYEKKLGCDLLAVSVLDDHYAASGDECYKIFRKYRVINWCEYNDAEEATVISRDEDCDNNPGDEAVWVLRRPNQTYVDRDSVEQNGNPPIGSKGLNCDGNTNPRGYWKTIESKGFWEYTQVIKVYDTIAPLVVYAEPPPFCTYDNVDCNVEIDYRFLLYENCSPLDIGMRLYYDEDNDGVIDEDVGTEGIAGQYPKFKVTKPYPLGAHAFVLEVFDGCGNTSVTRLPFEVVDCKAPNPICINGLSLPLEPVAAGTDIDDDGVEDLGTATIWATDFLVSLQSDCLGPVRYSINRRGDTPNVNQTSLTFTCADLGTQIVEIYGWDNAGNPYAVQPDGTVGGPNYDHCETFIIVQSNGVNPCGITTGSSAVAGIIETENHQPVANVGVHVSGGATTSSLTDASGAYFLNGLEADYDYTVTPQLNTDPLNGVSTFDLVFISKHILNEQLLDSPYKMIAADINRSGNITTADLIQLRRMILLLDTEFPNNTSWRFVPRSFVFPNPATPFAYGFPELININNLPASLLSNQDFVAVKIGDVNGSVVTNFDENLTDRQQESWILNTLDQKVAAGQIVKLPVNAPNLQDLQSLQFTLGWDASALEFVSIEAGAISADQVGQRFAQEGKLTASWNGVRPDMETLFTLNLRATKATQLSDVVHIAALPTPAEVYDQHGTRMDVALEFTHRDRAAMILYQNEPNPFSEATTIRFYLPEAGEIDLQFYTANGQVLKQVQGNFPQGENRLQLNKSELAATGLVFYEIRTTAGERAVRRMVIED